MSRRRKLLVGLICLLVTVGLYVATFSYWWLRSPSKDVTIEGKTVHVVHFTFNKVSYYSGPLWVPAFWSMEHVFGYEYCGIVAMYHQSIYIYAK